MIFLLLLLCFQSAHAFTLSLSQGKFAYFTIAPTPFVGEKTLQTPLSTIIRHNLTSSIYFQPVSKKDFVQDEVLFPSPPQLSLWKAQRTQYVLTGKVMPEGNKIITQYHLWDTFSGSLALKGILKMASADWRRGAHIISDHIHEHLLHFPSCFDTQIAFIHETHKRDHTIKQLAIMDQDGGNIRILTPVSSRVMTPIFSPNTNILAFTSFTSTVPKVYFINLTTGDVSFIQSFPGMTYAPRFSPDGKKLIFSGSKHAESNIYTYDLTTNAIQRLTNNNNVETSPCYSPDGKHIVFTSGLDSQPHLFIMDANGENRRQLTTQKGGYSAADWSPDGSLIAFTKSFAGEFYIGVIKPDGTGERLLTKGFMVEGPRWSPNGQYIVFCRQERAKLHQPNPSKICVIDVSGHNEFTVSTVEHGSDPTWSAALPTAHTK